MSVSSPIVSKSAEFPLIEEAASAKGTRVALLTGGGDRPYALGLAAALTERGIALDFIGSDDLKSPALEQNPLVRFLNLRGDQRPEASPLAKLWRVVRYYVRLLVYAATSKAKIFHLLWNNKWETFDRTVLMLYYRFLGKRVVLTVHNANKQKRDGKDTRWNRATLRVQYRLADRLFVHTAQMGRELEEEFAIPGRKISIIPFGVNSTVPDTALTTREARDHLGLEEHERVLLFFGNIAPYKGLEFLIEAVALLARAGESFKVVIAGRPKGAETYWANIQARIVAEGLGSNVLERIEYVPDADTEIYFKAADVLILPYTHIFQSGVLFLGYNFGLPVIASDVGSLKEDIVTGVTGHVCPPSNPTALAGAIEEYFSSDLFAHLGSKRAEIRRWALERNSWSRVGEITDGVYSAVWLH